jgi:hypothetical protein
VCGGVPQFKHDISGYKETALDKAQHTGIYLEILSNLQPEIN